MLVLNESLLGCVLLAALIRDFFVLFGHFTLLQLVELRLIFMASGCLIFAFCVQLALKNLRMGQFVWVVCNGIIPARSCIEVRRRIGLAGGFFLARLLLPRCELLALEIRYVAVLIAHVLCYIINLLI